MNERRLLLQKFEELPSLINATLAGSPFQFPKRIGPRSPHIRNPTSPDTSVGQTRVLTTSRGTGGAISNLRDALQIAAGKPQFGATSLAQWETIMQFAGSKIRRRSNRGVFEIVPSREDGWSEHDAINASAASASCWFTNVLLARISDGASFRHGHAVLGGQGCGKSTLIKYLVSKHVKETRQHKIVFSRFEFLKFWEEWRRDDLSQALTSYLTFIHLRDLLLDRFFDFVDGNQFKLKFKFANSAEKLEAEIESVTQEVRQQCRKFGQTFGEASVSLTVETCVAEACKSNGHLMSYIRGLEVDDRLALIGGLWDDQCVVTIFDGLDELHLEDAFQDTDQWQAVRYIIKHRRQLSSPTRSQDRGINLKNDSIVVMRKSTLAFLEFEIESGAQQLGLRTYYQVRPINSVAAMASVVRRALTELPEFDRATPVEIEQYTFKLMKVLQRTMLAIGRSEGGSTGLDDIYNLFDGNLRDLFKFAAGTIEWSSKEMLRSELLKTEEIFGGVRELIDALSSSRGSDFLSTKSYRVIEQILLREGGSFENAAVVLTTKSKLVRPEGRAPHIIQANADHLGQIDNIFNYLNAGASAPVDTHTLLEKVRIVQLLWDATLPDEELADRMIATFGYAPWNDAMLVKLMLKTGFLAAEAVRHPEGFEIQLRSTARGKLCITSLLGNLAYIEHVFHRTLFPGVLVGHVADKSRDNSSTQTWAIASIRNAFIFLTYFRHIEGNAAKGVPVPAEHRLFEKARRRVVRSIDRMTSALDRHEHAHRETLIDRGSRAKEAAAICAGALSEIEATLKVWRDAGAIAGARNAA